MSGTWWWLCSQTASVRSAILIRLCLTKLGFFRSQKSPEMRTASVVVRVFDSWRCAEKQADPCLGAGIDWIWGMGSSRMAGKVILFFRASEMQPNSGQNI